jgi:hypothetical protein
MNRLPVLAAALTVAAAVTAVPATAPAGDAPSDTPTPEHPFCSTRAIPPERLAEGEESVIGCYATRAEALAAVGVYDVPGDLSGEGGAARADSVDVLWATHWDYNSISSPMLDVTGPDPCDTSGINLGASSWNDRIELTQHWLCGQAKHWQHSNNTGTSQVTAQSPSNTEALNGSLANQMSSARYQ